MMKKYNDFVWNQNSIFMKACPKQSTNLMLDFQLNKEENFTNTRLRMDMSVAIEYVLQSRLKDCLYLVTQEKEIIRTENLTEGREVKVKKIKIPEGLDLAEVKLTQIESFKGNYLLIDTNGKKWATHESMNPEEIEG